MKPGLVLIDYRSDRVYDIRGAEATARGHGFAAEHAGVLTLAGERGRFAFADDLRGELVLCDENGDERGSRIPIATPAEHIAGDESGRYVAITTGLGANAEAWSDVVTVADIDLGSARRFRSRVGEPGVGIVRDRETGEPHIVFRHREPGSIEAVPLQSALAVGPHVPVLRGEERDQVADDGHGDVADAKRGVFATSTSRGLERFVVTGGVPQPIGVVPWPVVGRAFYLRFDERAGAALGVVRGGPADPTAWADWTNHLVEVDLVTGATSHVRLPDGLAFRFALSRSRVAVVTIHPDGDELTVIERGSSESGDGSKSTLDVIRRVSLPALSAPPTPGHLPWDPVGDAPAQRRSVAIDPTGAMIAVTRGGDGELHLITDDAFETVAVPTSVDEGGLLLWCGGAYDGVGR
ncbi:hypothetical protein ACFWHR_10120 [Leucobacter sp. NPDC058333]|uniref:hypothetical protein n=1 Tax=Leucobacter sp. NPDC058333 TaxID=3346450 RepID=UPI00365107FC